MKSNQLKPKLACLHNAMFAYKQQFAVTNLELLIITEAMADQAKSS